MTLGFIRKCLILALISCATSASVHANRYADYGSSFYEDEGRVTFKVKLGYMLLKGKQTGLPDVPATTLPALMQDTTQLLNNGFDLQGSTTLFFHDRVGLEFSVGFQQLRITDQTVANIGTNYSGRAGDGTTQSTRGTTTGYNIYGIPLSATLQFHIAPFAGIRPYVGVGGYFHYLFSKSPEFATSNAQGLIAQVGVDFVAKDDAIISLEVKKYFLGKINVTYTPGRGQLISPSSVVTSTVNADPLIISLGIGFKF